MAYTTTSSYKENIYNSDIEQTISVIINNKTVDPSFVKAIKYDDKIFEVESISIGNAVAREIQLELSNQFTEEFTEVSLSSTLHIETPETLALGTYMVVEKDNSNDYYTKYILHDYMDKFHKKYDASSMVPCTRFALLQSICNYCGVELENSSIINGDVIVNTYDNTIEALEYVRCIAERAAGNAKITRYNKLKIKKLNTNENIILPNEMVGDYSYDDQKTITKVIFENATQKFEKGNNTGECICLSQYSPFSCTQEEVNNIFQSLNGLTYQSLKARIWGDPSVDAGDRLTYGNIKSFAQMSWQWGNGFYGEYDCSLKTNQQTSLVEKLSNSQKIRRIKSILDESNMQIDLLLEENDENKTSIANLNLGLESIESSVTKKIEDLENNTNQNFAKQEITNNTIINSVQETNTTISENYATKESVTSEIQQTKNSLTIEFNEQIEDLQNKQVDTLKNQLVTIDINGIQVATNLSKVTSIMQNNKFAIQDNAGTDLIFIGYDEVEKRSKAEMDNLTVKNYFTAGYHRQETFEIDGEKRTGWFYVGGDI